MKLAHIGDRAFHNAARYDRQSGHFGRKLYRKVVADVAAANLPDGTHVLDAGTGPGRVPMAIAHAHPTWTVEGLDLEPRMIEYARTQDRDAKVTFTVGDVAALPYPDATFDLIISSLSQHHWSDVDGALRDLRRVLRPGGELWIYDVRFVLRRARRVAGQTFHSVRQEPAKTTSWPIPVLARVVCRA
jgi:ubiquinone/menaquinone biosynthesis C-methylase UbiE